MIALTAFAPSNVDKTLVNPPSGCGQLHERPVIDGRPVTPWALECQACNKFLTGPLGGWGGTISEIPETYDEGREREDREKRGSKDLERATGDALSELAKLGDLPAALRDLTRIMTGQLKAVPGDVVRCTRGHENAPAAKFCGECGSPMGELISATVPDGPQESAGGGKPKPLKDWKADDLRALARGKGLSDEGTRADLLARIKASA